VEQRDFHSSAYCVSLDSLDVLDDLDFNGMDWMGLNVDVDVVLTRW